MSSADNTSNVQYTRKCTAYPFVARLCRHEIGALVCAPAEGTRAVHVERPVRHELVAIWYRLRGRLAPARRTASKSVCSTPSALPIRLSTTLNELHSAQDLRVGRTVPRNTRCTEFTQRKSMKIWMRILLVTVVSWCC